MPECANYYGDLEFGNEELVKAGNFFKYFCHIFFIHFEKIGVFGFFAENYFFFVKFAGVDPEVLGIDRQRSQSGQRVPTNSFSSFSDFDDNDFASFDEPILVPAIIPARPKPIEKINTNR